VVHRNSSVVLRGTTFPVPSHDGIQPGLASVNPMAAADTRIQSLAARLTGRSVVLVVDTIRFGDQAFSVIAEQGVAQALSLAIATILVTVGLIVAALATSLVLGLAIVRQVVRPIQGMAATAQAISSGDLSRRVRVPNRDEIGVLADSFNSMTSQLLRNMDNLEQQVLEVKQAEESLRRVNETLQALIDHSPLAIIMLDLEGRILLWNSAAERMYGWTAQEAFGGPLPFVRDDQRDEMGAIIERVSQGAIITDREFERRHKDGSRIFTSVSIAPLRDSSGGVYAYMSISTDITKRKKVEEEKAKLESQLLHAQKMESVGRLAGGVAHDFNNMLSVILGYAELLKSQLPAQDPLQKYVAELEKAGIRSRDITRQLLAFSRKQIITPKPVDLNGLVEDTKETLARLIGEDVDLRFCPGENLWRIKFDPSQVDQILVNLAVNARDAMPSGGKLTIETSNVSLDEAFCREHVEASPGDHVVLEVSDNGTGMDKETLSHVFEPFFTTKEVGKGTGLGLATVYGIVKQNQGFISVYSEPGQGTTFKIHIPRFAEAVDIAERSEDGPLIRGTGTLLLVEDDALVRKMTKAMLDRLGYTVLVVESPAEALALCAGPGAAIDLLITDVVMPGMSGPELCASVKARKPEIKVLFMSGYTSNVIVHRGVLEEGVNFIQKPFGMNALSRKVHEVING
jgi:PAS domain S-box-containing protein